LNHDDHVRLIRAGVAGAGNCWADLGSGEGAFTLALRDLLGPDAEIYSFDKDRGRLQAQALEFATRFPNSPRVHLIQLDLGKPFAWESRDVLSDLGSAPRLQILPTLDGVLMANSLHFFRDKIRVLKQTLDHIRPGGRFVLVEYNADRGNMWVPHPLSFTSWQALAASVGFTRPILLERVPSRFMSEIYSAVCERPLEKRKDGSREPSPLLQNN
jgi:SAM-dependent methyltransferase